MFNLNHLYYFHVVATEGSVSSASRKLRLSQPALSVQIKQFEQSVGQRLFSRTSLGLTRTAAGDLVYQYSSQMFELAGELDQVLKKAKTARVNVIRMGVAEGIERPFSVRLIRLLFENSKKEQRPRIQLTGDTNPGLVARLNEQRLDAILTDQEADDLLVLGNYEMPVVLAVPASEVTTGCTDISLDFAKRLGLVVPATKFKLRLEIDQFLRKRRLSAPIVMEGDLMASVVRAVIDGVGAGLLPMPYVVDAVTQGKLRIGSVSEPLWHHSLWLLADRAQGANPLLAELKMAFDRLAQELDVYAQTSPSLEACG